MNREIKFRGLRTDGKGWVYGYYIAYRVTGGGILYHHIKNPSDTFMVSVESVAQYTGLKDKNGNEIYEGDIVTRNEYPYFDMDGGKNYVSTVEWIFNGWQTVLHCVNPKKRGISSRINEQIEDDTDRNTDFTVIGNVHQTPELLSNQTNPSPSH